MKGSLIQLLINVLERQYKKRPRTHIKYLIEKTLRGKISSSFADDLLKILYSHDKNQKAQVKENIRKHLFENIQKPKFDKKQYRPDFQECDRQQIHTLYWFHIRGSSAKARIPYKVPRKDKNIIQKARFPEYGFPEPREDQKIPERYEPASIHSHWGHL